MCELFCLSSRRPTIATFSLHAFAQHGGLPSSAIDGWGLAFHDGHDVRLYKEPEPAANSAWLDFIARHAIPSRTVVSHIRHATRGDVSLANTQPFVRELGGRVHVFAHNGRLREIERLYPEHGRFQPIGETDSEIAFCILLDRLATLWDAGLPGLDRRCEALAQFATDMRGLGPANFLYTDGDVLFAHGDRRMQADGSIAPPGLWMLERECAIDRDAMPQSGVELWAQGADQRIVLLASVPLTSERWRPLAAGELVAIDCGRVLRTACSAVTVELIS